MANVLTQSNNNRKALLSTGVEDDYVDRGYGFAVDQNFSITSGSTLYILVDFTTYTDFSVSNTDNRGTDREGTIIATPPHFVTTAGPVIINVYTGSDYSGGSSISYSKLNTNSTKSSQVTITSGATGSNKGTNELSYIIGSAGVGTASGGGGASGHVVFLRNNTETTLLEINNESGTDITFHYGQVFFEV